jgi:hypothetical protein
MLHVVDQDMECLLIILQATVIIFQFPKGFHVRVYFIKNGFWYKATNVTLSYVDML